MPAAERILLVDDEPELLHGLARELRAAGWEVEACADSHAALARVRGGEFALIITDNRMPGLSGIELLEQVQAAAPETLRFMLTAYAEVDDAIRAVNRGGIHRFLTKPWQRDELQSHVAEALERWRLRAEQRRLTDELHRHNAELAAVNQDLRHLASRDRMTGLLNRAEFEDALRVEAAAWKPRRPLCLALADVDGFKAINDAHGHPAGDAVLCALASLLATGVRSEHDAVYRYGGEEFAVLLRDTALETAAVAMERLRGAIAAEPVASPAGPLAVTMSFGVGALDAAGDPAALVAAVDTALYRAKAGGRNRVVVA